MNLRPVAAGLSVAIGLLGVGAAVGCSGPAPVAVPTFASPTATTSATAAPAPTRSGHWRKACDLITGAEAAVALGAAGSLTATKNTVGECEYDADSGDNTVTLSVETEAYDAAVFAMVVNLLDPKATTKIDGLGDAALRYQVGDLQTQYHVWARGKYVMLTVSNVNGGGETDAPARHLADLVVARL